MIGMTESSLYHRLSADIRFQEGMKACINCGTCTAICPAARFSDYDPRIVVDTVQRNDESSLKELLASDTIWNCGECLSCKTRCPRGNTPGYIIQALRSLSIKTGLFASSGQGRKQMKLTRTIGEHMLKYGYCVHIDEVDNEHFPEQGPVWKWFRENQVSVLERLGANYQGEGAGTLRKISEKTLQELSAIFSITGAFDYFKQIESSAEPKSEKIPE